MSKKINPEMTDPDEGTRADIEMVRNLLEELERDPNPDYLDDLREANYNVMHDQLLEKLDGEMDALTERFEAAVKKMAEDVQKREEVNVINISVPSQDPKRPASKLLNAGVTTSPALEAPKSDCFVYRIVDANDLPISLKNRDIVVRRTQVESTTSNPTTSSRAANRSETITSKEGIPATIHRLKDIVVRRAQVDSDFKGFDDESPTTSSRATNRSEASISKGIPSKNPLLKGSTSQVYNPKKETSNLMTLCNAAMSTVDESTLLKTRLLGEPYKIFKSESTSKRLELYTAGREKWGLSSISKNIKAPIAPKAPGRAPPYSYKDDLISFLKDNSSTSRKVKESPSVKEVKECPSVKEVKECPSVKEEKESPSVKAEKESPNNNKKASSAKSTRWDKCIAELSECGLVFPSSSQRSEKSTSQPDNSNKGNQSDLGAKEEYAPGLVTYDTPFSFQKQFELSINGGHSNRKPKNGSPLITRKSSPELPSTVVRSARSRGPSPDPVTVDINIRNLPAKRRLELSSRQSPNADRKPLPSFESIVGALKPLVFHEDPKDDVDLYPKEPKIMKK